MARAVKLFVTSIILFTSLSSYVKANELEHADVNFWQENTFHQETVDMSKYANGIVRAKKDGEWQEFKIQELPAKFMEWNINRRLETLTKLRRSKPPSFAGPHSGMVATHGIRRWDTQFLINNAVKGMGFVPQKEKIKEIIELLNSTMNKSSLQKLDILGSLYKKSAEIFDPTKQVSLELYSTPDFETHTFLNQMANPDVAVVFLDIPSFELKCIAQLLHPENPKLTAYEKEIVEYVNLIHSYFHGEFSQQFITVIYHVIEVYDNSPGSKEGMGRRITP